MAKYRSLVNESGKEPTKLHTEISQFQFSYFGYKQVLRLDVPVKNPTTMAVAQPPQQLKQEQSNVPVFQSTAMSLHVLRQISVLKSQRKKKND